MNVRSILDQKGSAVETAGVDDTLGQAAARLRDRGIGALVVTHDRVTIVGILSERDVVSAVAAHGASALGRSIGSVMTSDVVTCVPSDSVEHLMGLMTDRRIRHVPVVDPDGRLAGIVSIGDVVKDIITDQESMIRQLEQYIRGE